MKIALSIIVTLMFISCYIDSTNNYKSKKLRFEKINYFKYPKSNSSFPIKYKLTYYFDNEKPYRWVELDSLKNVTTEYIYEYDNHWKHQGAKYREDGETKYSIEKVRLINDSTQVTEWLDSLGKVYYTMTDFLNKDGKTERAEFKGDKIHGYDSTFYTKQGFPERIFFTNIKGKVFNDRQFMYDSINTFGNWIVRNKIMKDTIREIQLREVYYDSSFVSNDGIFYPMILSTDNWSENTFSFTKDERTIFQSRTKGWEDQFAFLSKKNNGVFCEYIQLTELDTIYNGAISPSGDKIIYSTKSNGDVQIWLVEKTNNKWSKAKNLTQNSGIRGGYFYWWTDEDLFFYVPEGNGNIVYGKLKDRYLTITDSLTALNTELGTEFSPWVDKRNRFIVFTRYLEEDTSQQGFFISYNKATFDKPKWSAPNKITKIPYGWNAYFINDNKQFLYTDGEDIKSMLTDSLNLNYEN